MGFKVEGLSPVLRKRCTSFFRRLGTFPVLSYNGDVDGFPLEGRPLLLPSSYLRASALFPLLRRPRVGFLEFLVVEVFGDVIGSPVVLLGVGDEYAFMGDLEELANFW